MRPLERLTYRPSGQVDWPRFLAFGAGAVALGLACGLVFAATRDMGGMQRTWIWLIGLLLVVAGVWHAIDWGLCRNRLAAMFLAMATAFAFCPGYYHWEMVGERGLDHLHRLDELPAYINQRLWNDRVPGRAARRPRMTFSINVMLLGFKTFLTVSLCLWESRRASRRVFGERSQRWMDAQSVALPAGAAERIATAFNSGDPAALAALADVRPKLEASLPWTEATAHFVRSPDGRLEDEVYLSLYERTRAGAWASRWLFDRQIANLWLLTPAEVRAAGEWLPALAGVSSPEASATASTVATRESLKSADGVLDADPRFPFLLTFREAHVARDGRLTALSIADGILAGVSTLGAVSIAFAVVTARGGWIFPLILVVAAARITRTRFRPWMDRLLTSVAAETISGRLAPVVRPDDHDAWTMQFLPHQRWRGEALPQAADHGFAALDDARGRLLFEGRRHRWVIPVSAIVGTRLDRVTRLGSSAGANAAAFSVAVATIEWHEQRRDLMFFPLVSPEGTQSPSTDPDRLVRAFLAQLDALRTEAPALVTA